MMTRTGKRFLWVVLGLTLALAFFCGSASVAESGTSGNFSWTLDDNGVMTITGEGEILSSSGFASTIKRATTLIIGEGITRLPSSLCKEAVNLISVSLPDTVNKIGDMLFLGCSNLKNVRLSNGLTSLGQSTFARCSSLENIFIPEGITEIGTYVFSSCTALREIDLPDSIVKIDTSAFDGCTALRKIKLPAHLSTLNMHVLEDCTSLETVIFPEDLTKIGQFVFSGCTGLKKIILPHSVEEIGLWAFSKCTNISDVFYQGTADEWAAIAIDSSNTAIINAAKHFLSHSGACGTNLTWTLYDNGTLMISGAGSMTSCPWSAYASNIQHVTLETGITDICPDAFNLCSNLSSIIIPDSVISISERAFANCRHLTSVTIPDSVTNIGECAFLGCNSLNKIIFPDHLNSIGSEAFSGCSSLTSISIPDGVTSIVSYLFSDCSSLIEIIIPNSVIEIGKSAFERCSSLTDITIPDSVTQIGESAFKSCSSLTEIVLPDHLTFLDRNVFFESGLTHITLPGSLSTFDQSFFKCQSLTSVILSEGITAVGDLAFEFCEHLTDVTLPESLSRIGNWAFCHCKSLKNINLPDGVTNIGKYAFSDCPELVAITIPNGVTNIGESTFSGCSSLTSINIPNSLTSIVERTFSGCSSLTSINIPNGVTSIGMYAFNGCSGMTSIIIPDSVTTIDYCAFYGCSSLTELHIPNSVTLPDIDQFFDRCSSLTSITIPDSMKSWGPQGFSDCINLTEIHIYHCNSLAYQAMVSSGYTSLLKIEEHSWSEPVYTWSEDHSSLAAVHSCENCEDITETETVPSSVEVLTPSTCTVQGEGVYTSAAFENEAFSAQTINAPLPLAEHIPFIHEGFPATCTEEGLTDEIFCDECGTPLQNPEPIPALGHDWQRTASTWAEDGSSCLMTLTCARCGETAEAKADVSAEAEENTSCTKWAWTTFTASLTYDEMTFNDTMMLQNVEPIPHTPEIISPVAPTCTESGLTEGQRCSVCGEILEAPEIVPALGHEWQLSSAVWAEDGSACTFTLLCGRGAETQTLEANVTANAEENTSCTEWAQTTYTASVIIDGQTLTNTKQIQDVEPAPHQVVVVPAVAPTDREPGYTEKQYCSLCGLVLVQSEEIPALWSYSDDGLTVTAYNGTETDLTIPEGVTALSTNLFQNNTSITSLRIPEGVTTIGALTCFQATNLREVWLPDSLTNISSRTFHNVHAVFHANAGSPSSKALSYLKFNFTDSNGWTLIYFIKSATAAPTAVSIVNIPDTVETSLTVPADIVGVPVTELQSLAVANHAALTEVHLPDNLVTIAADSFDGCPEGLTIYSSAAAPARTWAQENGFAWAHEAHQPEILSAVTPTCTEDGLTEGSWCPECGEILTAQEIVPALGHDWSTVTYAWTEDNSTVTASHVCAHNAEHVETETVPASAAVTKQPTCEENGETTYTSEAFENPAFSAQSKIVANIASLGHDWSDITYTWAEDNSTVTASRICAHNPDHTETETAIVTQLIVSPTETSEGSCEWISNPYENEAFIQQTKSVTIPALNSLSVLRIPAGVQTIEEEAFEGVPAQAVLIPDGCTAIGRKAFAGCTNLLYVRIPASVTSIAANAFDDCPTVIIDRIN